MRPLMDASTKSRIESPLRPEALADGEHPLGEARSLGAVRSEGTLAPQHTLAHGVLGCVVRGLDALDLGEGTQRRPFCLRRCFQGTSEDGGFRRVRGVLVQSGREFADLLAKR